MLSSLVLKNDSRMIVLSFFVSPVQQKVAISLRRRSVSLPSDKLIHICHRDHGSNMIQPISSLRPSGSGKERTSTTLHLYAIRKAKI